MPRFVYPPRPKTTVPPSMLPDYDSRGGWLVQLKFDGDRCVAVVEDGKVHLTNRHGKFHPSHTLSVLRSEISALNLPPGTHYLDGELLHPQIDQTLVLFDVLQYQDYLIGWNQLRRLELLADICKHPVERCAGMIAFQVSPHVWLAERWSSDFAGIFEKFTPHNLIEGVVLRQGNSLLEDWGSREYNVSWQVRCRKPSKKYRY